MPTQNIWQRRTEIGLTGEEFREAIELHLLRHIGEPHTAFSDADGWSGKSKEPGPAVDVLVSPPEGERRFAYVSTFGSSMKKSGDAIVAGGKSRLEFVLAAPQKGDPKADLAMLNLAANTVRQFAKLVHLQGVRVTPGETVQFAAEPKPMFEGSKQVAFAFMRPRLPADAFETLRLTDGELVRFVAPVPIYQAELKLGRRRGPAVLAKALNEGGVTEMLDFNRQPVARVSFLDKLKALFSKD
jgi:suppressor of fused protein SUFU